MRKALVVGLNDYAKCPLKGCVNDASVMAELLAANGDGSPNFDVHTILGSTTKDYLMEEIQNLFDGKCDVELFYFSGHGTVVGDKSYIVTTDYGKGNYGVNLDDILEIANKSAAKHKVIILDSCYSGSMGTPKIFGNGCAQISNGMTIFTSCLSSESSKEINGHGVFTSLFLEALKGGAADVVGNITPGSVYAYIDKALGPWEQRPVFKTNVSSFLPLRKVDSAIPLACLRKITTYFKNADTEYKLDPSFEDTNTPTQVHKLVEPYADKDNVKILKDLQKYVSIGLVQPVDEDHMYYAAMHSKSCRLTPLGKHFWYLVFQKKI